MNLSVGIVGLPNVGKSTLFNALLKRQIADAANYPFCTIEPNIGVVEVPDERLAKLAEIVHSPKLVPAIVKFVDIAGLVKGASKGEGLGNKFLSHIREVSVIAHVIRSFKDENVVHVQGKVDPKSDMEIINSELILADLETIIKNQNARLPAGQVKVKNQNDKEKLKKIALEKLYAKLNIGILAKDVELNEEELGVVQELQLLTMKPVIYVVNVDEDQLRVDPKTLVNFDPGNTAVVSICAKTEQELSELSSEEQKEYLKQLGLEKSGLERLIKVAYDTLGLISFLTAGEKEVRAWTIKKGTKAPQAAGVIHTDFATHFIKAEIASFVDFVELGGWTKLREKGKVRFEGKEYEVREGDVIDFKVNA